MRFPSPSRFLTIALIAVASLILLAWPQHPAAAQQPPADDSRSQPPRVSTNWLKAVDVDFAGGSGTDYITSLRKASPEANIVVLGDVQKLVIPAVRLRNVSMASALEMLERLPPQQGNQSQHVKLDVIQSGNNVEPVFALTTVVADIDKQHTRNAQTNVVSLADVLGDDLKPADALTAIETALGLIKTDYEPAQIKFHEQTGLLITRGTPEQIESIIQVIQQLRERAGTLRERHERAQAEQQIKENAERSSKQAQDLKSENEKLRQELTMSQTKTQVLEQGINDLRTQVSKIQDELRKVEAERDALAARAGAAKP